jgi:hypothetical protein
VRSIQILKNLIVLTCLATSYGCQNSQVITSQPGSHSDTCTDMPQGKLDAKDVKKISLESNSAKESGTVKAGQNLAYSFDAKTGNKLSWRTSENICVWVFSPDTKLLKGSDLPSNGNYTVQVSAPKGITTFTLEMGLGNTLANNNSPTPSTPIPQSSTNAIAVSTSSRLTQDRAALLVQNWLSMKGRIFGPPFDRQLVSQYMTGLLYRETMGSIDWLVSNSSYYTYASARVDNVWAFNNYGNSAAIKVRVTQDLTLHNPNGGIDPQRSGITTDNYVFYLTQENGAWKMYDRKKVD